jgi:hypothetical protein
MKLESSQIDRQNILNNGLALTQIQQHLGLKGLHFEDEYWFTVAQTAQFYEVSRMTLHRYLNSHEAELKHNGYQVLKGERLKSFKSLFAPLIHADADEDSQSNIDVTLSENSSQKQGLARLKALGVFNFRAFLNIGMLLSESERAKHMRSAMLDIVIDVFNQKLQGSTKYINQRDEDFLQVIQREPQYRQEFTQALNNYLEMGNYKYAVYTDKIYEAIFKEKAQEYREILKLEASDKSRDTMYSEILTLIAAFETGLAHEMQQAFENNNRQKITPATLNALFLTFSSHPLWLPQIKAVREKMACRDYALRQVIHNKLEGYLNSLGNKEFERFLGDSSKTIQERIEENLDVFKRLKDR